MELVGSAPTSGEPPHAALLAVETIHNPLPSWWNVGPGNYPAPVPLTRGGVNP